MELPCLPADIDQRFGKSWTAYASPTFGFLIMLFGSALMMGISPWVGAPAALLSLTLFVLRVLWVASVVLYTDQDGVWVYQGLFPWSRGVIGVNWRDAEDASYAPGFFSWMFNSYTVRIGHRFTKSSEIQLSHIANGSQAVVEINDAHRRALAQ